MAGDGFVSRWARRKAAARTGAVAPDAAPASPAADPPAEVLVPTLPAAAPALPSAPTAAVPAVPEPAPLPTLDDVARLTKDSDFSPYVARNVDAEVRNAAMKKLFSDPHFNVMDGLDTYIDDYSRPSPLAPEVVRQLAHARYLFSPPRTRINAEGHVEDVPDEELPEAAAAEAEASGGDLPAAGSSGVDSAAVVTAVPGAALEVRHLNPCATPASTPAVPVGREDEEPSA